ncbi:unnamed protein product [Rotaria socialis]|uniref:Uncharacterized protein n=1 Tax=Rotaria socialis TaxID=392032 RepID=A0A817YP35_9BILA|nr:unnamed protein product [Rotaria socialis]CAF3364139.1 unnamed protein product [Rotaria socialis]CAF3384434.1 unnamed protein product [Rotaria socialis]CAF3392742.1 unnamed protein product [Rotaria socialis]CAF3664495.1 unnamed protein product [Rotaria socialis]
MSIKQQQFDVDTYEFGYAWQRAQRQGWYLVPSTVRLNEYTVFPPQNHPAALNRWAAVYRSIKYGDKIMIVPHWFLSEVKRSPNYSQGGRWPEEEMNRTVVPSGVARPVRTVLLSRNIFPKSYIW